jgi:hypothetical protein
MPISPRPRLNRDWHRENRLPRRATLDERIAWHLAHQRHCACRAIPGKLLGVLRERGLL